MSPQRLKTLSLVITLFYFITLSRFFYWQIVKSAEFSKKALAQLYKLEKIPASRGKIFSSDSYPLVQNQQYFKLAIYKPNVETEIGEVITAIKEIEPELVNKNNNLILKFIGDENQKWIEFNYEVSPETKAALSHIAGISFIPSTKRYYPEDSLAKNILGSTKISELGNLVGINGIEAYYQKQLEGKTGFRFQAKDAQGKPLITKDGWVNPAVNGLDLHLSLNRSVQFITQDILSQNISKFQADSGSVTIINPSSGEVISMVTTLSPDASLSASANPPIDNLFEPGSIFKPLVIAIGLDSGRINTHYSCTECNRPLTIGEYTITNWNNEVHPDTNLFDTIKNSDNISMSHIIKKIGLNTFLDYHHQLKLNTKTGIDLQGETKPLSKKYWPEIDLATASFGQGIALTQIQMIQAFNAIANDGVMVQPHLVTYLKDTHQTVKTDYSRHSKQVFKKETTDFVKELLQYGVENGTVSRFKPDGLSVCAKSGTAQVALKGDYQNDKTIASYIGFTPCDQPAITMIVTINNPRTSPWGASTAAPIWFEIANRIIPLLSAPNQ